MSLLNLGRATISRLIGIKGVSEAVASELKELVEPINAALGELESDHRCKVALYQTSGTGLTLTTGSTTQILWEKPAAWPGGDTYVGYDTGLLHANQNRFVPTKSGLYYIAAQVEWEPSVDCTHDLIIAGFVGGTFVNPARTAFNGTYGIQQVSVILPYDAAAQQSEFYAGHWSIHARQTSGGDLDIVKGDYTWAQVVRLR